MALSINKLAARSFRVTLTRAEAGALLSAAEAGTSGDAIDRLGWTEAKKRPTAGRASGSTTRCGRDVDGTANPHQRCDLAAIRDHLAVHGQAVLGENA